MNHKRNGFTLIELMIVVSVIGILAAVAVPRFAESITRSKEAHVYSNLGSLRSALSVYYANTDVSVPANLTDALIPVYIGQIPSVTIPSVSKTNNPGHSESNNTTLGAETLINEPVSGDIWFLVDQGSRAGKLVVNCVHLTTKGLPWSSY